MSGMSAAVQASVLRHYHQPTTVHVSRPIVVLESVSAFTFTLPDDPHGHVKTHVFEAGPLHGTVIGVHDLPHIEPHLQAAVADLESATFVVTFFLLASGKVILLLHDKVRDRYWWPKPPGRPPPLT
jgi:hypothetical protein